MVLFNNPCAVNNVRERGRCCLSDVRVNGGLKMIKAVISLMKCNAQAAPACLNFQLSPVVL